MPQSNQTPRKPNTRKLAPQSTKKGPGRRHKQGPGKVKETWKINPYR